MGEGLQLLTRPLLAGALLYDARELFDQQNAKADEGLRSIVQTLPEAVAACVDAAEAELEEPRQVALMKVGGLWQSLAHEVERKPRSCAVYACKALGLHPLRP